MYQSFLCITLLLFAITSGSAQENSSPEILQVTYDHSYKLLESDSLHKHETMRLLIQGMRTSFMENFQYKSDSIFKKNGTHLPTTEEEADILLQANQKTDNLYRIHASPEKLGYYSSLGIHTVYRYEEIPSMEWQLTGASMNILGYSCKSATISYGGRAWTAWYAPELPYNAGPYKFKGLPGLILSIHDATNDFSFEMVGLKKIQSTEFLNVSPATKFEKAEKVTRKEFHKLKRAFDQLSIVEKLNYGSTSTISIINSSGEDLTKQRKLNKRSGDKRVYMEAIE